MRRLIIGLFLILPTAAFAQVLSSRSNDGNWVLFGKVGGCIGGSTCSERRLRAPLEDRPVIAVRFHAHDQIGTKAEGVLRVKIDGNTVRGYIDIPRKGETFTIEVDELRGRYLVFEPVNDDEVEISEIAVLYANPSGRVNRPPPDPRDPYRPPSRAGGWRAYPGAAGCIGGDDCRRNGDRITVALEDAPVLGVRFYAHDSIGQRADGKLRVRIDDTTLGWTIDVQRAGKRHELEVESVYGKKLVIETANDDEVDIKDVEVLYGRASRRGGERYRREVTHEGGCIGGDECGGRRARIRIAIYGQTVNSIRFYARDDIGTRAGGVLRIRIDDEVIEYSLDIPREGRTFNIDGRGFSGDYLIIEPAEDDEVEVKDVRVKFEEEEN